MTETIRFCVQIACENHAAFSEKIALLARKLGLTSSDFRGFVKLPSTLTTVEGQAYAEKLSTIQGVTVYSDNEKAPGNPHFVLLPATGLRLASLIEVKGLIQSNQSRHDLSILLSSFQVVHEYTKKE